MDKLKAIIFDIDGTLANTEKEGHLPAFNFAFAEQKLGWCWDNKLYTDLLKVTGGKERIRFYIDKYNASFFGDNQTIVQLHQSKTKYYVKLLKTGIIPLRTGILDLISVARLANITLAIATTTSLNNVLELLKTQLGEDSIGWFKVIGAGENATIKKPATDIYQFVLDELKIPVENCIAIEDSHNGLLSAKGVGLKTVITTNEYTENEDFTGADLVINQVGTKNDGFKVVSGNHFSNDYLTIDLLDKILRNGGS